MTGRITPELVAVMEAACSAAMQALKTRRQAERRIAAQIAALQEERRLEPNRSHSPEALAGAGLARWMAWGDGRLAALQSELAAERVRRETALRNLRRAYGRKAALEALARQEAISSRRSRARRAECA